MNEYFIFVQLSRSLNHLNDPLRNFLCFIYCHINRRQSQEFSDHPWEGDLLMKYGRYFAPTQDKYVLSISKIQPLFLQFIKPSGMPWVQPEGEGIIIRFILLWKAKGAWARNGPCRSLLRCGQEYRQTGQRDNADSHMGRDCRGKRINSKLVIIKFWKLT